MVNRKEIEAIIRKCRTGRERNGYFPLCSLRRECRIMVEM